MSSYSRRSVLKGIASSWLLPEAAPAQSSGPGMATERADTPKLCAPVPLLNLTAASMRRIKQIGVSYVLSGGPKIPWEEAQLRSLIDQLKTGGLTLDNLMISGFTNTLYGRPGRDEEIENVRKSIRAAGKVGVPVVEYNFYAHRAMEGYYEETGRAGAGSGPSRGDLLA